MILPSSSSEWDIDWDYAMGVLPTDRGWTRTDTSESNATQTLRDTDVRVYVKNSSYGLTYNAERTNSIAVLETEFQFTNDFGNLMMFVSDGESYDFGIRAQYSQNYNGIYLYTATTISSMTKVQSMSKNTYYKLRLVTDGYYGYLYVNDVLKAGQVDLDTMVATSRTTRIRVTDASTAQASYTNIHFMRAKFGRL